MIEQNVDGPIFYTVGNVLLKHTNRVQVSVGSQRRSSSVIGGAKRKVKALDLYRRLAQQKSDSFTQRRLRVQVLYCLQVFEFTQDHTHNGFPNGNTMFSLNDVGIYARGVIAAALVLETSVLVTWECKSPRAYQEVAE